MLITVAICTWNRAEILRRTLDQVARLTIPPGLEWELLVVNNNSTDHTDDVLASFEQRLPLRRAFEARPGVANARNRAVQEARGAHIVFTDDDVFLDPAWLLEYARAFVQWPEAVLFGGPIAPRFEGTPPRWVALVLDRYPGVYGRRDLGEVPTPLTLEDWRWPFGANYAVRIAEQRRFPYDPSLGRRPDQPWMLGEETEVFKAILRTGHTGRWVPNAKVWHWVPRPYQTRGYLRRWFFGWGQFLTHMAPDTDSVKLFGRPRWLYRQAMTAELRYRVRRLVAQPAVWLADLVRASELWGRLEPPTSLTAAQARPDAASGRPHADPAEDASAGPLSVTVAICTWNRAALLRQALERLTHLVVPQRVQWELCVVNNNCTDDTDAVIGEFERRLPIRRLSEARPGKSSALNLAAREARGDYILWTDDDAIVDREWLAAYSRAFRRWPDAALFGGPVAPAFAEPPPGWLQEVWPRVCNAYAIIDWGDRAIPLSKASAPYGVNMAVRTDWQRRYLYDPDFGPGPGRRLRGEETTMIWAILQSGGTGWWVPDARVRHFIPAERLTIKYLRHYFAGYGEWLGKFEPDRTSARLFGRPRWMWRRAVEAEVRYRVSRLVRAPTAWIEDLQTASIAWGRVLGDAGT